MATAVEVCDQVALAEKVKGVNIGLDIHFVRHGRKKRDGELHEDAVYEAERLGEAIGRSALHENDSVEIFTGSLGRVQETAAAIARGWASVHPDEAPPQSNVWDLLSHTTFLLDKEESTYFRRVNARLESAYGYSALRREKVRQVERRNMQEWIASGGERLDEGTASPREIALNAMAIITTCLDAIDQIPDEGHKDIILVTHEYIVASVIRYLLAASGQQVYSGSEIFSLLESVDYLEDVTISVRSDAYGERYMYATMRGEHFFIHIDQDT